MLHPGYSLQRLVIDRGNGDHQDKLHQTMVICSDKALERLTGKVGGRNSGDLSQSLCQISLHYLLAELHFD